MKKFSSFPHYLSIIPFFLFLLIACAPPQPAPQSPTETPSPAIPPLTLTPTSRFPIVAQIFTPAPTRTIGHTPTPDPTTLTICLGSEPDTL